MAGKRSRASLTAGSSTNGQKPLPLDCFIVSPIGLPGSRVRRHADRVLKELIHPALKPVGFVPKRADTHVCQPGGSIPKAMVRDLHESPLCVAILTDLNPNVMYEVGVRHAWDLPIVHLADKGLRSKLPFDIATRDTVFYSLPSPKAMLSAVEELGQRVRTVREQIESTAVGVVPTIHELLGAALRKLSARFSLEPLFHAKQRLLQSFCEQLRRNRKLISIDTERNQKRAKPLVDFVPEFLVISRELRAKVDVFEEIARTQQRDHGPRKRCEPILNRIKNLQRDLDALSQHLENAGSGDRDVTRACTLIDSIVEKAEAIEGDCVLRDS